MFGPEPRRQTFPGWSPGTRQKKRTASVVRTANDAIPDGHRILRSYGPTPLISYNFKGLAKSGTKLTGPIPTDTFL